MKNKAYTLVEILIVVALMSVIAIVGYKASRTITREAIQLSHAGSSSRKADFDRLIAVLNDRLNQAWGYTLTGITSGTQLSLIDANGSTYATLAVSSSDNQTFSYQFNDIAGVYTQNPLQITYGYTNSPAYTNADFLIQEVPGNPTTVNWKIPPPTYYTADYSAFIGMFLANNTAELQQQVDAQRDIQNNNTSGLLQYDLQRFTWSPIKHAFR